MEREKKSDWGYGWMGVWVCVYVKEVWFEREREWERERDLTESDVCLVVESWTNRIVYNSWAQFVGIFLIRSPTAVWESAQFCVGSVCSLKNKNLKRLFVVSCWGKSFENAGSGSLAISKIVCLFFRGCKLSSSLSYWGDI